MRTSVTIELTRNLLPALDAQAKRRAAQIVAKTARDIEGGAKANAPVESGNLKNSIQAAQVSPLEWEVRVGAEYGIYVHDGTFTMRPRPFLRQSIDANEPAFNAAVNQLLGGV